MQIVLPDELQPAKEEKEKKKSKARPRRQFQMPEDDDFAPEDGDADGQPSNPLPGVCLRQKHRDVAV